MSEPAKRLTEGEIAQLVNYLRRYPPREKPPPDMPFLDIRRIALTLDELTNELNVALRVMGTCRCEIEDFIQGRWREEDSGTVA